MNESSDSLNLTSIRTKLDEAKGAGYWRSLDELTSAEGFKEFLHREFPRQASEWIDDEGRRNFLKVMGASLALAGLSACTKQPTEYTMPYVEAPEQLVPGKPLFYATAFPISGIANPILVETHEFRPTKVEGNPDDPASQGSTDVPTQASVLGLYDPDRLSRSLYWRKSISVSVVPRKFYRRTGEAAAEERRGHSRSHRNADVAFALRPDSGFPEAVSGREMGSVGTHGAWAPDGHADGLRAVFESRL